MRCATINMPLVVLTAVHFRQNTTEWWRIIVHKAGIARRKGSTLFAGGERAFCIDAGNIQPCNIYINGSNKKKTGTELGSLCVGFCVEIHNS